MNGAVTEVRGMVMVQLDSLSQKGEPITQDIIRERVERLLEYFPTYHTEGGVNGERLIRDLESDYNVHVGSWNSLADDGDHVPWFRERRAEVDWRFWDRYCRYLRDQQALPPSAIERLDEITNDILARLEAPDRPGAWDRRGLVSGQVQSGKTANYAGLICKAIDSGYKLVVVLAGVHNSLRSQTQSRIDEGILGFDTRNHLRFDQTDGANKVGVGMLGGRFLPVNSFTSSKANGDFRLSVANNIGVAVGGSDPIVLVVKKNKSILENLFKWATALRKEIDPNTGLPIVRGVPVLVIDDEADHASVDTNGPKRGEDQYDPSVINGLLRKFLRTFEQTAYVAYTATPFANIFISPNADHDEHGEDLFPRSFIVNLPAPSTYIGPTRVFGLTEDPKANLEQLDPLPIVRDVRDYGEWLPDGHKSSHMPGKDLPSSLKHAILTFLMAGAVRALRGQGNKHHSMLVHVTRFTNVQREVAEQITSELTDMSHRLTYGEGDFPMLRSQAEELYEEDLNPTNAEIRRVPDVGGHAGPMPSFDEVWAQMAAVAQRTHIHVINGKSDDAFEYIDHPEGVSVIAVGGDKLSRGLTLEGLCVSYYLRASRMYDTLMQMGRWFGYRAGYLDLCRLYTTPSLSRWYTAITAASEELQQEFEAMAAAGRTPRDFGLRVRQHPDGLLVTSAAKLRHSKQVQVSFAATISETVTFESSSTIRRSNWSALETLLTTLQQQSDPEPANGALIWRSVSPEPIIHYLSRYLAHPAAVKAQPTVLADYVRSRSTDEPPELTSWTVLVANKSQAQASNEAAGVELGLTYRQGTAERGDRHSIRRVVSPSHELIELKQGTPGWEAALQRTVEAWKVSTRKNVSDSEPDRPAAWAERAGRSPDAGLLLIYPLDASAAELPDEDDQCPFVGFAVSFPGSQRAKPVSYQVNTVFWDQEFGLLDEIEDE